MKVKYLILGAGPAGLSFAARLKELGEESFLILEKEEEAGGLCRSHIVDGSPLDIGGGHFLDVKRQNVLNFLFKFMPREEWDEFKRISKIKIKNMEIDYPIEANIWQLPLEIQIDYLISIFSAGCNIGKPMPENFRDWINWRLGDKIAEDYMIPYNNKIFSTDLNNLGSYWMYKLPKTDLRQLLRDNLSKNNCGESIPAHSKFFYPKKFGYGEVWKRIAESLKDKIIFNESVKEIDFEELKVNNKFKADTIITTIPWDNLIESKTLPENIKDSITKLKHSSIEIAYSPENILTDAHWIYVPDESLAKHRILCRHNFCANSRGHWTETNLRRVKEKTFWKYENKYAYPLNTIDKPEMIKKILDWANRKKVYGLGRWGIWEHMNSDVVVEEGISLAEKLFFESK